MKHNINKKMAVQLQNEGEKDKKCVDSVFEAGNLNVKSFKVKKSDASRPPAELFVVSPEAKGCYPTLLFCHGYCTQTTWYSQLLHHISSHGYIILAPQFYQCLLISLEDEIKTASKVIDWLSTKDLPQNIKPDLSRLALMGHSRGGKVAFALALSSPSTPIKALVGLDPVSGPSPPTWVEPNILSYIPHSFNLSVPIAVIGTGLSNQKRGGLIPPLAPDGYNHSEFFNESRPPCAYFLARDYGHCDVLDDSKVGLASLVCRSGKGCKEKMRRGVGGLVVAFLKAHLGGDSDGDFHLQTIVDAPAIAPITLDPIIYITK